MSQYIVTTPKNPQYSGKTYGVRFQSGRAFVSEHTIDPSLGWSADEIAKKLHDDFGYTVEPVTAALPIVQRVLETAEGDEVIVADVAEAEARTKVVLPRKNKKRNDAGATVAPEE